MKIIGSSTKGRGGGNLALDCLGIVLILNQGKWQEPLQVDLVISFPEHGFHLRFEPRSQVGAYL